MSTYMYRRNCSDEQRTHMCHVPSDALCNTDPPHELSTGSCSPASGRAGSSASRWHRSPVHQGSHSHRPLGAHRPLSWQSQLLVQ